MLMACLTILETFAVGLLVVMGLLWAVRQYLYEWWAWRSAQQDGLGWLERGHPATLEPRLRFVLLVLFGMLLGSSLLA